MQALAIRMGRTVGELSASMTTAELAEWAVANRRIPLGDERFDYLFAQVCLRIFQAAGIKKSDAPRSPGPNDWTIDDFLLFKEPPPTAADFLKKRFGHLVKKVSKRKK